MQIKHMKEYIARFGHGSAKLARQAQSKEKTLEKMVAEGLTEKVERESVLSLKFANVGKLPPPVLQVRRLPRSSLSAACFGQNMVVMIDTPENLHLPHLWVPRGGHCTVWANSTL